jgi:hypothetical protein
MLGRKEARGGPGRLVTAFKRWKIALFAYMFIITKKTHVSAFRTRFDLVIRLLQMLGFVVTSNYGSAWPIIVTPVELVLSVFNADFLLRWYKYQLYMAFYYLSLSWVVGLVVLTIYCLTGLMRNTEPTPFVVRCLRLCGSLSAGPLFIPVLHVVSSPR